MTKRGKAFRQDRGKGNEGEAEPEKTAAKAAEKLPNLGAGKTRGLEAATSGMLEALDPKNSEHLLKDPKIRGLIDNDGDSPATKGRSVASVGGGEFPAASDGANSPSRWAPIRRRPTPKTAWRR